MSKKIIYLLSLLMALSLVFASCKKNGNIMGSTPSNGYDDSPDTDDGLALDSAYLDQYKEKPIKNDQIETLVSVGGQAYYRNPVIVVLGPNKSDVVVFTEKRYKTLGAANDIGIDGNTAVDIVYSSSTDSGKNWNPAKLVGKNDGTTAGEATKDKAYAAPVVFKVAKNKVVVVAASGVGLSRVNDTYDARVSAGQESKLVYTIGTYTSGSFKWEGSGSDQQWVDMTDTIKGKAAGVTGASGYNYAQFSVHSGRGFVNGTDLYFAVTVADQGSYKGTVKEAMGSLMVKGSFKTTSVEWSVVDNNGIGFTDIKNNYSKFKESCVIGIDSSSKPVYIAVGSPYYANNYVGYQTGTTDQPKTSTIAGSEGSASYLLVEDWRGATSYEPSDYKSGQNKGTSQRLFAHVKSQTSTITMYALNDDVANFATKSGTTPYTVIGYPSDGTTLAKSSSMDVLGDGTIIMVAEQGGTTQVYNVVFKRFTQEFLAKQLGISSTAAQ